MGPGDGVARITQYTADVRGYRARQVIRSLEEEEVEDPREEQFEGDVIFNYLILMFAFFKLLVFTKLLQIF